MDCWRHVFYYEYVCGDARPLCEESIDKHFSFVRIERLSFVFLAPRYGASGRALPTNHFSMSTFPIHPATHSYDAVHRLYRSICQHAGILNTHDTQSVDRNSRLVRGITRRAMYNVEYWGCNTRARIARIGHGLDSETLSWEPQASIQDHSNIQGLTHRVIDGHHLFHHTPFDRVIFVCLDIPITCHILLCWHSSVRSID